MPKFIIDAILIIIHSQSSGRMLLNVIYVNFVIQTKQLLFCFFYEFCCKQSLSNINNDVIVLIVLSIDVIDKNH